MIYITGDKHADFSSILDFCNTYKTTKDDILIVLFSGVNFMAFETRFVRTCSSLCASALISGRFSVSSVKRFNPLDFATSDSADFT